MCNWSLVGARNGSCLILHLITVLIDCIIYRKRLAEINCALNLRGVSSLFLNCSPLYQPEEGRTIVKTNTVLWKEVKNKKAYSHYGICAWQCIIYTVQNIYIKTLKQSRKCVRELNQGVLAHNAVGWWDINEQGMCPKIIKDIVYVLHFPVKRKKKSYDYQSI